MELLYIVTDINRTPISKTRQLSSYQLTHDTAMLAWASDIHAAARHKLNSQQCCLFHMCISQGIA